MMKMEQMDLLDKKILSELDLNCRKSHAMIARSVRSSRAVVSYRIKKLEQQNIIRKYITAINLGKLGFNTYKIYFKLFGHDEIVGKEFVNYLLASTEVIHCIKTQGNFDFSIVVAVKNIIELDNFLGDLRNKFSSIIRDYRLSIIVSSKVFGRVKILLGKREQTPKVENFSGACENIILDDKDKKILWALSEDASKPIMDVAKKTGLTTDIAKYRIKKLVQSGVINNFRLLFDINRMGFYHYVFLLNMRSATKKDEGKIITWCQLNENVLYITKRVGFWDHEINVALKNIDEFNAFANALEKEFSQTITSYETIIASEVLKLTYFPFENPLEKSKK